MKKLLALLLSILMLLAVSSAETADGPQVQDTGLDLLGSSVHYPQITGMADETVQTAVNQAIMEAGHITDRLNRMAMLVSSPVKLNVTYTCALLGDVFSCAFLADGAVETARATQAWSALTIDLRTGESIPFDALFTDADAARADIEAYLEEQVVPELSAHLGAGALLPIPETFSVDEYGLTLHYPIEQYETLAGRAGTVRLWWHELRDHLAVALPEGETDLEALLEGGSIPGIPAALGEMGWPVQTLIDNYGLLSDPDVYEGGQMIALEDDRFRQVWLLVSALTDEDDLENTPVLGIRADRGALGFLLIGETAQNEWRSVLGEPDATLTVTAERADSWRILPGVSDYYDLGDYRLRLHADETGVLRTMFLTQSHQ